MLDQAVDDKEQLKMDGRRRCKRRLVGYPYSKLMPSVFDTDIFGGDHRDLPDGIVAPDAFEEIVHRELQRDFSPDSYQFERNVEHEFDGGRTRIRPDEVVYLPRVTGGDRIVACVADAKFRKRLTKEQAERVVFYGGLLAPQESLPRIYIPEGCLIDRGAQEHNHARLIEIRVITGVRAGSVVEVTAEQAHVAVITAAGRGGVMTSFAVEREHDRTHEGETWQYLIRTADESDFFEARFVAVGEEEVQSVMINNNGKKEFSAKGIPEALFALVVRDSRRTLVSSADRDGCTRLRNEYRSLAATNVWRRLENAGLATYEVDGDRFTYLGLCPNRNSLR